MLFTRPVPVRNSVAVACLDACSTRGSPNDSSGKSSERPVHLMSHGASRSTSTLHGGPEFLWHGPRPDRRGAKRQREPRMSDEIPAGAPWPHEALLEGT